MAKLGRAARIIKWIEQHLRIPDGMHVGDPVRLTAKQKQWIRLIYDSPTRTFILSMGRKNAKTAFSAMLLLVHVCGPEVRANSQLYSAAQSRDQAGIIFDFAAKMARMSPELRDVLVIRDTAKEIACPEMGTLYKALSADATTALGRSPLFIVHDELGQVVGPKFDLYESLETACAAQAEPLSLIISTQARSPGDLLSLLIDDARSGADPRVKCVLYTAPTDAERTEQGLAPLDAFSDAAIRLANPHFDSFMNRQEVRRQAAEAKRLPARENAYRNLILNQRVEARNPFISRQIWQENGAEPAPLVDGAEIYGGLDLSSTKDLTSLVLAARNGELVDVYPTFWLPEDGLAERSRVDHVPYDLWARQGLLETTPGASIKYEFIAAHLREVFHRYSVKAIAFDRYNMGFLKAWLDKLGFSEGELACFVEFGQGFASMSPAIRELETRLLARQLRHAMHPALTMCAANATVSIDPAENRKFVKSHKTGRIDGMVALTMAVGVMGSHVPEPAPRPAVEFW